MCAPSHYALSIHLPGVYHLPHRNALSVRHDCARDVMNSGSKDIMCDNATRADWHNYDGI